MVSLFRERFYRWKFQTEMIGVFKTINELNCGLTLVLAAGHKLVPDGQILEAVHLLVLLVELVEQLGDSLVRDEVLVPVLPHGDLGGIGAIIGNFQEDASHLVFWRSGG